MTADITRAYDLLIQADDLAHKLLRHQYDCVAVGDVESAERTYRLWWLAHGRWGRRAWAWHKMQV